VQNCSRVVNSQIAHIICLDCGTCLELRALLVQDMYLVGTDTGEIVKCNTAISSHYAASFKCAALLSVGFVAPCHSDGMACTVALAYLSQYRRAKLSSVTCVPGSAALCPSNECRGHHMPVYTVRWNWLHTRTFLSCGADWALKVWDEAKPKKARSCLSLRPRPACLPVQRLIVDCCHMHGCR
jgi:hypothetical protein